MQPFIETYRNPIFGILVLLLIILLIVFTDSFRTKQAKKKKKELLNNLGKNFENITLDRSIKEFVQHVKHAMPTLMTIAQTYSKAGNYEQAIAIYKILNEYQTDIATKTQILESLGESYYKAGFLERSKMIFTEILRNDAHNIQVLHFYLLTCENLKQYDEAIKALDCMEEIYLAHTTHSYNATKFHHIRNYLKVMQLSSDYRISLETQQEKLLEIYNEDESLRGLILRHFYIYSSNLFWECLLHIEDVLPYTDILWYIKEHEIPFNFLQYHVSILNVYRAKGYVKDYVAIDHFALEVLQVLRLYSHIRGDLEFTYSCTSCGGKSPFYSYRCLICEEVNTINLSMRPILNHNTKMD